MIFPIRQRRWFLSYSIHQKKSHAGPKNAGYCVFSISKIKIPVLSKAGFQSKNRRSLWILFSILQFRNPAAISPSDCLYR